MGREGAFLSRKVLALGNHLPQSSITRFLGVDKVSAWPLSIWTSEGLPPQLPSK